MKKRISALLILMVLVANLFSVTALAADVPMVNIITEEHADCQGEHTDSLPVILITEEEFKQLLNESSITIIRPQIISCCDGSPRFAWRHVTTMHIYPQSGGTCLGIAYFGDKYCTRCGSVWESSVCYKQTAGCGKYHY